MIKNKAIKIILFIIILIAVFSNNIVYADDGLPDLNDTGYIPSVAAGGTSIDIISKILSVFFVMGIVSVVVGFAMVGFKTILGSASEKAVAQEQYVGLLIATLVIVGLFAIVKFIIIVAESIGK